MSLTFKFVVFPYFNKLNLIFLEGNEDDPETVLERLRYEEEMRRLSGFNPFYQQKGKGMQLTYLSVISFFISPYFSTTCLP